MDRRGRVALPRDRRCTSENSRLPRRVLGEAPARGDNGRAPARSGVSRPIKMKWAFRLAIVGIPFSGHATPDRAGARPLLRPTVILHPMEAD